VLGGAVIMDLESFDKIEVAGSFTAGTLGAKENVGAAASLGAALEIANGAAVLSASSPAPQLVWFQYGSNTYLYADLLDASGDGGGLDALDNIVQIVGLVDLEASPFTSAGIVTVI